MARKNIEAAIGELNKLQGFSSAWYRDAGGNLRYNVGAFQLDYMQPGDSTRCYQLERIDNEDGGTTCPLGYGRMTAREIEAGLDGLLYAMRNQSEALRLAAQYVAKGIEQGAYSGCTIQGEQVLKVIHATGGAKQARG